MILISPMTCFSNNRIFFRFLWLAVLFGGFLSACEPEKPEIAEGNSYAEGNDELNGESSEATGLVINGKDWIELAGTFNNGDDKDQMDVDIDPELFESHSSPYKVQIRININGSPLNTGYEVFFPADAMVYNDSEDRKPNNIVKVAANPIYLQKGDTKIKFTIIGTNPSGDEKVVFSSGKKYSVMLK